MRFLTEQSLQLITGFPCAWEHYCESADFATQTWEGIKGETRMCLWGGSQPELQMTRLIRDLKTVFRSTALLFFPCPVFPRVDLRPSPFFSSKQRKRSQTAAVRREQTCQVTRCQLDVDLRRMLRGRANAVWSASRHCPGLRGAKPCIHWLSGL